jgi:hypothetical protein
MNNEAFEKVVAHLAIQSVYPVKINFIVAPTFEPRKLVPSYTRINWETLDDAIVSESQVEHEGESRAIHWIRFRASVRTRLIRISEKGVPPDNEEPDEADVFMDAKTEFAVEYLIQGCTPDQLDAEGMNEFVTNNMPYHLWPYYRETIQSLAQRARLPIPAIPSFRVPKTHQVHASK